MIKGIDHTLHKLHTSKLTQQTRPYAVLWILVAVEAGHYPTRNNLVFYYFGGYFQGVRHQRDDLLECSEMWECVWQLVV